MNGRLEHDMKIQQHNKVKLETMPDFVSEYYDQMKASRLTEPTCRDYLSKIYKFLSFINPKVDTINVEDITASTVRKYLTSLETVVDKNGNTRYTSDSYKQTVWICLNGFLKFLVSSGYLEKNYLEDISKPKLDDQDRVDKKRVLLTEDDFKAILRSVDKCNNYIACRRDKAMLSLMMCTGMRESALSEINLENLNLDEHRINGIAKGKKSMEYVFNDSTAEAIRQWLFVRDNYVKEVNTESLFLSNQGNRMAVNSIAKMVKKYTKAGIGKELSPHKLRAGYVSIIYNKTGNLEFARRAVGHASVNTTKLYAVTEGNERAEAADMIVI